MSAPKKPDSYLAVKADEALEANPPIILWEKNSRGVFHAVYVHDPHATGGRNAEKTACKNGHEYTPENTYYTSQGWRSCKACKNEVTSEWQKTRTLTPEQKARKNERERERRRLRREGEAA